MLDPEDMTVSSANKFESFEKFGSPQQLSHYIIKKELNNLGNLKMSERFEKSTM